MKSRIRQYRLWQYAVVLFLGTIAVNAGGVRNIGAAEFEEPGPPPQQPPPQQPTTASITPITLSFGNVTAGTTSAPHTTTLVNTGTAPLTGIALGGPLPAGFSVPAGAAGGTCGATLAPGATCTINVVFSPSTAGANMGFFPITAANAGVAGSPVGLTGTGVPATGAGAVLSPANWSPAAALGAGLLGPIQTFTLTNTGSAPLTGITQGLLSGANFTDFYVVPLTSNCGPAAGGQIVGRTTLAPGASCSISVQFRPIPTEAPGTKTATLSVSDSAGTQSCSISGTAN